VAVRHKITLAATLAEELLAGDAAVIATALYDFGVSRHPKAWIDLPITDPHCGPGTSPLAGLPVTRVIARGGGSRVVSIADRDRREIG
jgi:FMN-dependent NADH-azoreductase